MKLRPGNTFSSQGAGESIREIFPILPVDELEKRKTGRKRYFRGNSAFCEQETIHACLEFKKLWFITSVGVIRKILFEKENMGTISSILRAKR
jgi:hypothetical protein